MANFLTFSRLFLIPLFLFFMFSSPPQKILATIIFVLAALTDTFDGYIARRFNQVTELGKAIDPLTDRIFIIAAVVALYLRDGQPPLWTLIILLFRDIIILCGYIYLKQKKQPLSVSLLGKTATAFLMTAIAFMILGLGFGQILFYIGFILYLFAAFDYVRTAIKIAFP